MNTHETLIAMNELLPNESRWAGTSYMLDKDGVPTEPDKAHKVCLVGAHTLLDFRAPEGLYNWPDVVKKLQEAGEFSGFVSIYNDTHTFKEIKATLLKAIENTREKKDDS